MADSAQTHYDVLGVSRDAKAGEIVRAHDRLAAELRKDTTPPDARRDARVREALDVLSDPERRDAYDASLLVRPPRPRHRQLGTMLLVGIAVAGIALYLAVRPGAPVPPPGRPLPELVAEVSRAVARVQAFEMSGTTVDAGLAFAIEPGVMLTTCQRLAPGAQLTAIVAARTLPARISMADEALGLCRLAVDGAASWPLTVGGPEPKVGDKVYVTRVGTAGDAALAETTVKRIMAGQGGRIAQVAMPVPATLNGGPLIDGRGRVVGVTSVQPDGQARHVLLPSGWAVQARAPQPAPPAAPSVEPAAVSGADSSR